MFQYKIKVLTALSNREEEFGVHMRRCAAGATPVGPRVVSAQTADVHVEVLLPSVVPYVKLAFMHIFLLLGGIYPPITVEKTAPLAQEFIIALMAVWIVAFKMAILSKAVVFCQRCSIIQV